MDDQPTRLWSLSRDGHEITCDVTLVTYGIEITLARDGEAIVTRVFETGEEALGWAEQKRANREADGWKTSSA
jgi:hypothetical protein